MIVEQPDVAAAACGAAGAGPSTHAYLDHAASTAVRPEALSVMVERLGTFGNASSLHTPGREQRRVLEESRESLAALTGVRPNEVIFTSGGTEANNLAIKGYYRKIVRHAPQRRRIIVAGTEHPSALATVRRLGTFEDVEVAVAAVDGRGQVDVDALRRLLNEPDRVALVVVMAANNETGALAPIARIGDVCRNAGVWWHCDAVQAAPWLDLRAISALAAGVGGPAWMTPIGAAPSAGAPHGSPGGSGFSMSISGHKLGAPVGVGALVGFGAEKLQPLLEGGGQEGGARPGTSPVALAASLVAAASAADRDRDGRVERVRALRDHFWSTVADTIPDTRLHTPLETDAGLPGHALISFVGADADSLLLLLDAGGVAASAGSACSAGLTRTSPVLTAMGVDRDQARSAVRFSLGWNTTVAEVAHALEVLPAAVAKARVVGAARGQAQAQAQAQAESTRT